jgi:hypothetical protein
MLASLYRFKGVRSAPGPDWAPILVSAARRNALTETWRNSRPSPGRPLGDGARLGAACRSLALRATAASARDMSPRPPHGLSAATNQRRRASCKSGPSSRRSSVKPGKITRMSSASDCQYPWLSASSGTQRARDLQIRRCPYRRPVPFGSIRGLGCVLARCPGGSAESQGRSSVWLPAWLPSPTALAPR